MTLPSWPTTRVNARRETDTQLGHVSQAEGQTNDKAVEISGAVEEYSTDHNATLHRRSTSAEQSLRDFFRRNSQYFRYIDLMPVSGFDGQSILDFGCGPGYDLVGFATQSKPARLIGVDVSKSSLDEAGARLELHDANPELYHMDVAHASLPVADASIDLVHSSGVLHHMNDMAPALAELRRVLKKGGTAQFMVYHRDSLWTHLYDAYERQIVQNIDTDLDLAAAFQRSTDGPECRISLFFAGRSSSTASLNLDSRSKVSARLYQLGRCRSSKSAMPPSWTTGCRPKAGISCPNFTSTSGTCQ